MQNNNAPHSPPCPTPLPPHPAPLAPPAGLTPSELRRRDRAEQRRQREAEAEARAEARRLADLAAELDGQGGGGPTPAWVGLQALPEGVVGRLSPAAVRACEEGRLRYLPVCVCGGGEQ